MPPPPLHIETHGTGDPIILVHGYGANIYSWRHLVGPLARHHAVLAVDLKGFGASPKPPDGAYSVHDQAGLLSELIVARGLMNLTLVGHSLGGGVALATTLALAPVAPERIRRLVLIDSIAYAQTLPWFIRVLRTPGLGELAVALVPPARQVRMVLRYAFHDPHLITDDIVAAYAAPIGDPAGRAALVATARQLVLPDMESFTDRYREIDLPVLLLWGRQDRVVPVALGHRLRAALPQADLQVIDACGHVPHEEHPSTALDAIERFLTVHAGTP